jgi:hypothetical protein
MFEVQSEGRGFSMWLLIVISLFVNVSLSAAEQGFD